MSGFEIKPCTIDDTHQWAEFLDRNFGYAKDESYSIDFAPLFATDALNRSRLVWENGKIASSATLYPVTAITTNGRLNLGVIGAVATDELCRGRGYSKQLLAELENLAQHANLDALILWSDQIEFYGKLGFAPMGHQEIYTLESLPKPSTLSIGTAVYGWDWGQVRALYEQHGQRTARTEQYWESISNIRSCTRVQWVNDDGRVQAYLGFDRGKDLQGIIHEWGGEPQALHSLLWVVVHSRPNLLWLTHPCIEDPIRPLLTSSPLHSGHLALVKQLNKASLSTLFERIWFWGLDSL